MTRARRFPLRFTHLAYWLAVLVPLLIPLGWALRGQPGFEVLFAWLTPLVLFVLLPVADALIGRDVRDPAPDTRSAISDTAVPAVAAISYFAVLGWALATVAKHPADFPPLALLGWVVSLANAGGVIAINVAHELIHRRSAWQQQLGGLLLSCTWYGCFKLEHPRWHHVKVATPEDPSSAPRGSSVYTQVPRALLLNTRCGWALGAEAARRAGRPPWMNEMLAWYGISAALTLAVVLNWGVLAGFVFVGQAIGAAALLEVVNYVEHYGLRRQRLENGRFEPPRKQHSWDADFWLSNALLIQLPRHADHHVNPTRPFPALQRSSEAPQLPFGYATAVLVALLPPLWRQVMDKRLTAQDTRD